MLKHMVVALAITGIGAADAETLSCTDSAYVVTDAGFNNSVQDWNGLIGIAMLAPYTHALTADYCNHVRMETHNGYTDSSVSQGYGQWNNGDCEWHFDALKTDGLDIVFKYDGNLPYLSAGLTTIHGYDNQGKTTTLEVLKKTPKGTTYYEVEYPTAVTLDAVHPGETSSKEIDNEAKWNLADTDHGTSTVTASLTTNAPSGSGVVFGLQHWDSDGSNFDYLFTMSTTADAKPGNYSASASVTLTCS